MADVFEPDHGQASNAFGLQFGELSPGEKAQRLQMVWNAELASRERAEARMSTSRGCTRADGRALLMNLTAAAVES
jgi:hypothetical protein